MALPNGDLITTVFDPQMAYPVDKRMQVDTLNSRDSMSMFIRWEGMEVYVLENKTKYILQGGRSNEFWKEQGTGSGTGGTTFVGQFPTADLLPTSGRSAGDYAFVGTGDDFVQYNWDNIANEWVMAEGQTDMASEFFHIGYKTPLRRPVIFPLFPKDVLVETSGDFVFAPETAVARFIFTGEVEAIRGIETAAADREIKLVNRTGSDIPLRDKASGIPSDSGFDFGGTDYTWVNGSEITMKGNGTYWELAPNNQVAFSDHLDSVNSQVSVDPNGLKTLSRILDFSGNYIEFKQQTQWFNETPITNSNLHFPVVQKIGSEFFMNSDVVKANTISVEAFRVEATDSDHTVLQRAFDFISAAKYSYSQFSFRIPGGRRYRIDQPLVLNTISDVDIVGDGIRKSSIIASAEMDTMITLSRPSGSSSFVGRVTIKDISLYGNNFVNCLVDGRDAPYSTYKDIEFSGLKNNGVALKLNGWVTNVADNLFSNQQERTGLTAILLDDSSQVNGMVLRDNSISTYYIGLHVDNTVNELDLRGNRFDNCEGTGIYFSKGSKGCNIYGGYFERCGYTGITVTKGAPGSPTETWKGAIIGHHNYVSSGGWFHGLNIWGNIFANCGDATSGTMTFSGLVNAKIEDNFPYPSNITKYWVDLRWQGSLRTQVRRVKINQSFESAAQIDEFIGRNADSAVDGHCGLVLEEYRNLSYTQEYSLPLFNNPMDWGVAWASYHESLTPYKNQKTIVVRAGSRPNKELTVVVDSSIAGRYYRINWFQKSADSATTFIDYKIDGVTSVSYSSVSSGGAWTQGGRGALIYIPKTATNISFVLRFSNQSVEREISGFSIVPASYEISSRSAEQPSDTFFKTGGTPEGFQFAKMGSISQDVFNGKTYFKTTDISLNTGWKEIADIGSFVPNQGATLSSTNGSQITGAATNGAITKTTIASGGIANGFPANIGDAHTYVGASLARSYSFFKERDTNKIWIQSYDSLGVGQGWVEIGSSSVPNASTTQRGIIEIATNTEIQTGTDEERAVTPKGIKDNYLSFAERNIASTGTVAITPLNYNVKEEVITFTSAGTVNLNGFNAAVADGVKTFVNKTGNNLTCVDGAAVTVPFAEEFIIPNNQSARFRVSSNLLLKEL